MKTLTKISVLSLMMGLYIGCSPVKFSLDDSKCKDSGCIVEQGQYSFNYSVTAGHGKVDILIVNDNSASMSFEQARLGERFRDFIGDLDARKIDYRIAMTTTDVSGSRGGKLLYFEANTPYLTPKNANREALFRNTLQRPETLACEKFIANWIRNHGGDRRSIDGPAYSAEYARNCPSGDERGIYAANLVVSNNPSSFIRNDAHLAVIFLSDEDVRSGLYNQGYDLHNLDQPATLVSTVKSKFGQAKYNSLSVHAIVVKDAQCLADQNNQVLDNYEPTRGLVTGSYGHVYLTFPNNGWGASANICSSNYQGELGAIRSNITDTIKDIMLNCSNPTNLVVTVSGANPGHWMEGKTLKFSQTLPAGASVNLSYKCSSLN
ncbi:hypothetical protein BDW_02990 [Bdellovibrio bacteriovorus W]|nr:hypothetical protein BDW_02990 [Bdellovibrio bacteriovorus W]